MIKILKGQEGLTKGIVVSEESKNASSLPFILHFLANSTENNRKVAVVSFKYSEMNYKLICSKSGIRWNPNLINFVEVLPSSSNFQTNPSEILENLFDKLSKLQATDVLFDDLSSFENFGASPACLAAFVHKIYTFLSSYSENPLVFVPFFTFSKTLALLRPRCHNFIHIVPVGHGFGKENTSKAIINTRTTNSGILKKGLLLSGERFINATWVSA